MEIEFAYKDLYVGPEGLKKFLGTFRATRNGPFNPNPREVVKVEFFGLDRIQEMIRNGERFHSELLFLLRKHFGFD